MPERPIIFSPRSIRAILDGSKTQTRRVVKPAIDKITKEPAWSVCPARESGWIAWFGKHLKAENIERFTKEAYRHGFRCPFGKPFDSLWVKEKWLEGYLVNGEWTTEWPSGFQDPHGKAFYYADVENRDLKLPWKSAATMPRWASRITLQIKDIRVERLHDISEEDAAKEVPEWPERVYPPLVEFAWAWDRINKWRGYEWSMNPHVFVISFSKTLVIHGLNKVTAESYKWVA